MKPFKIRKLNKGFSVTEQVLWDRRKKKKARIREIEEELYTGDKAEIDKEIDETS